MKSLLTIVTALAIGTTNSVAFTKLLNTTQLKEIKSSLDHQVSQNLELTDINGYGLKQFAIKWEKNQPSFFIKEEVIVTKLLKNNVITGKEKAKDKESFDFLRNVLKIKLESGTTYEDGIFSAENVFKIKYRIFDCSALINSFKDEYDKEKLIIEDGTYKLQFFEEDGKTTLGDIYEVNVKKGQETNALFDMLTNKDTKLSYNEFVYEGSPIEKFKSFYKLKDTVKKWKNEKIEVPLINKNRTSKAIKFNNYEKLIGWKSIFNVIDWKKGFPNFDPIRLEEGDELYFSLSFVKKDVKTLINDVKIKIKIPYEN
ncbi:MAG: hypothetical protein FCO83_01910 [Spiroplasma sp. WSS]|nr:MAG: hypothetical protein FCO83_01910 [Spiroplasma sp. WSS]